MRSAGCEKPSASYFLLSCVMAAGKDTMGRVIYLHISAIEGVSFTGQVPYGH